MFMRLPVPSCACVTAADSLLAVRCGRASEGKNTGDVDEISDDEGDNGKPRGGSGGSSTDASTSAAAAAAAAAAAVDEDEAALQAAIAAALASSGNPSTTA